MKQILPNVFQAANLVMAILVLLAFAVIEQHGYADETKKDLPEFFGVYIKMLDGKLIEIPPVQRQTLQNMMGLGDVVACYITDLPAVNVQASSVDGFYVFGEYNMDAMFLGGYISPAQADDAKAKDAALSIPEFANGYWDTQRGWTLERNFKYVQVKPNLYWVKLREGLDFPSISSEYSIVGLTFGNPKSPKGSVCYPFQFASRLATARSEMEKGKTEDATPLDEAIALAKDFKFEEALTAAKKSMETKASARVASYVAAMEFSLGRRQEAQSTITDALQQYPNEDGLLQRASFIASEAEDYENAIRLSRGFVEKKVLFAQPYNSLAWSYVKTEQNIDEAIKLANRALELTLVEKSKANIFDTLSEAYLQKGDVKSAMDRCEKGLKCDEKNPALLQRKTKIEFMKKEKNAKEKSKIDETSRKKIVELLTGTWVASLTHQADDPRSRLKQTEVRLVVKSSDDLQNLTAEYSFKALQETEWASFDMRGRVNSKMDQVMLLAGKKTHNSGPPWHQVDLFGEISKDLASVKWVQYGTEGEFRKEQ